MLADLFTFSIALFLVIKGATMATRHAERLAQSYRISQYTVGFIIVAIISILPEAFISLNAAFEGIPSFGLGILFGSNIADLTLVFAGIIFFARRGIRIEGKILKNRKIYPFLLLVPLILGLDGYFSRLEGAALIVIGAVFYYVAFRDGRDDAVRPVRDGNKYKDLAILAFSMAILLVGAYFTVTSTTSLAGRLNVNPILIGMLIVGVGTTVPEFFFSLRSVEDKDDSLAVGDILGTVLADATIVVGLIALVNPFFFPPRIIYVTGLFMAVASLVLFQLMRSGRMLSKKEGYLLFIFWLAFVIAESIANK